MSGLVFDMSNADYHADAAVSSSQLKALIPEEYKVGGSQEALDFGTLFHTVVLEPDKVKTDYHLLDEMTVGVKADGTPAQSPTMTAAWKRAVAASEAEGKTVATVTDWDRACATRAAV